MCYGVVSMVCGYVYGIPEGFIPAFIGDILGASSCFWLYRLALHGYINRKFKDNIEYQELSKAVSKDGILILFMIRLSSFPFAVLNAYFGAMTKLPYWKFILTTAMSTPRLFLPIFIGHNISSLANPEITGRDRTLKWAANIVSIVIALVVGYYIYRHTARRIKRINAGLSPDEDEDLAPGVQTQQQEQQQQQQQQQYGNADLTSPNQPFEDRNRNDTTTTVDMEEMKDYPGQVSNQSKSVETIVVDLDGREADRVDLEQGHKA
ncbi:Tlg2-vesicle protein [Haplosporangium sp. Z 11]|nr:Tlg2-vesicle protein [Haplosporangium sp. Z 11]